VERPRPSGPVRAQKLQRERGAALARWLFRFRSSAAPKNNAAAVPERPRRILGSTASAVPSRWQKQQLSLPSPTFRYNHM
jgi:hypothetical protein